MYELSSTDFTKLAKVMLQVQAEGYGSART